MAYTASTISLLTSWLRDWHADGLTDLWTDCLTYWLIDLPTCWLTVWPTDWLFNSLTDWLTYLHAEKLSDWQVEWQMVFLRQSWVARLVDCSRPVLLNLQANFLTMWVLPGLYHCFLTDWWWKRYGGLIVYWFTLCYQSWLNEYRLRGWLLHWPTDYNHLTGLVTG